MRITHNNQYQGWYMPTVKQFEQASTPRFNMIQMNQDVIETLRLEGCEFIFADVLRQGGVVERVTVSMATFLEKAVKRGEDLVCHV